ncbi:MAG: hypothetical protein AAFO07_31920 [Bacteroidota bacterium]
MTFTKQILNLLFFSSLLFIISCSKEDNSYLYGKWQAIELQEDGQVIDVPLDEISFSFDEKGIYTFTSTLNYREAGNFVIETPYLYTIDTLNNASTEKTVELIKKSVDTIVIKMEQVGKERLLRLAKAE